MHEPAAISVVIPSYNAARFLPATLRSVLAQPGFALEVLVVDDGSSDGTPALLAAQFPQVRLIRQRNQGVAVARNTGLAEARHDWVAFIDADDIWLPGKLQAQWALLSSQREAQMCYTAWQVWHTQDIEPAADWLQALMDAGEAPEAAQRWQGASGWIYPELLRDCVVWTSTVLARRSLLQALGGFEPGLPVGEDYDLWLRASRLTPIVRVPRPLALYRHHGANTTHRVPERNFKAEVVGRALARWGYAGPDGRLADRRGVDAGLARSWADFAGVLLGTGQARAARAAARAALAIDATHRLAWTVLAKSLLRGWAPGR
jgi:glycosyltransferase involved in cell wall biosynthesis